MTAPTTTAPAPQTAPSTAPCDVRRPPLLVFFSSKRSGAARRVDGYLAHLMQRRHNHQAFRIAHVFDDERPDLFERFGVEKTPTLMVVQDKEVACRVEGFCAPSKLEHKLAPWLN